MTLFHIKAFVVTAVVSISTAVQSAPVVVQKGSTAQFIYIPASSVDSSPNNGAGTDDGATSAKKFCTRFVTQSQVVDISTASMLDETVKVGAVLIGGGAGSNNGTWVNDLGIFIYASGGGGGSTALLVNESVHAVAPGGDASTAWDGRGGDGKRVNSPEFLVRKAGGTNIRVIIGGGGGSAAITWNNFTPWLVANLNSGHGGGGYFGGGGGARISSSVTPKFTWASAARGGTASAGGLGAVAPSGFDSPIHGTMGTLNAGGSGTGGVGTLGSTTGAIWYGQQNIGGYAVNRYEIIPAYWTGPEGVVIPVAVYPSGQVVGPVRYSVVSGEINESNISNFGKGSTEFRTSGVAGIVMLYYSAATCTML